MKTLTLLFAFMMSAPVFAAQVTCVSTTEDTPTRVQMELNAQGFQDIQIEFLDEAGYSMHLDAIRNDDVITSDSEDAQNIQLSLPQTFGWDNALLVIPKYTQGNTFQVSLFTYDAPNSNDPWEALMICK